MSGNWLREERSDAASERILDAAGRLFVDRGVSGTTMAVVAREAGCSRATLYRYFDGRRSLHLAYVNREARRIGLRVLAEAATITDPRERVVEAVLMAIREVRSDPNSAVWFRRGDAGVAADVADSSEVIDALGSAFLADMGAGADTSRQARWLVRVIVSLLTVPGIDEDDERATLEQFVVPVIQDSIEKIG
ncbi:TetR/AcrR family transcriptional regulator [Antrihabitans cavernicola]|uniref:TetR/AcrR family transcriptional regulator n=1 Tax=Antrihabitans cavernicola TaxID=2495913 RepID=A0A5A7SJP9_9NOCA|nr:TetR/AcrR family transcriptional regulator [Spelaeibacter cavernicola]KAA0024655.1 TetR/AcrR family transcriptional regulator [Spelaeibacter cavernicola]